MALPGLGALISGSTLTTAVDAQSDSTVTIGGISADDERFVLTSETGIDLSGYIMDFEYEEESSQSKRFPDGTTIPEGGEIYVAAQIDAGADVSFGYDTQVIDTGDTIAILGPDGDKVYDTVSVKDTTTTVTNERPSPAISATPQSPTAGQTIQDDPPNLKSGDVTKLTVQGQTYYLIDHIDAQPANRVAITTPNYNLVPKQTARDAIGYEAFHDRAYGNDWNETLARLERQRDDLYRRKIAGRALDLGWDGTEILVLTAAGVPHAGVATIFETTSDIIRWSNDVKNKPYQTAYSRMNQCLGNAMTVESLQQRLQRDPGFFEKLIPILEFYDNVHSLRDAGRPISAAFKVALREAKRLGATTSSASTTVATRYALHNSRPLVISLATGFAVDLLDDPLQLKTQMYAIGHAYCTMAIPIVRRLIELDEKIRTNTHTFADGVEYYLAIQSYNMMTAMAAAGEAYYWNAISTDTLGPVFDAMFQADEKAEQMREHSKDFIEYSQIVASILGGIYSETNTRTDQSLNAAFTDTRAQQSLPRDQTLPQRRGDAQ